MHVFIGQYIRQNIQNGRTELAKTIQGGINSDIRHETSINTSYKSIQILGKVSEFFCMLVS